jgi:hypothetical protein
MPQEVNIESLRNANRIFLLTSVILLLLFLKLGIITLFIFMSMIEPSMTLTFIMYLFRFLGVVIVPTISILGTVTILDSLNVIEYLLNLLL